MSTSSPTTDFDPRYSDPQARATDWTAARRLLADAGLSWISTVRPDGRPHVTPLMTVWVDEKVHFCTGPGERKFQNLTENPHVVLTTGTNSRDTGTDIVVEGDAVRVTDEPTLRRLAEAWVTKYGEQWRFNVAGGAFTHVDGGEAWVFAVDPTTAFGFGKHPYSQTRWRFERAATS